MIERGTGTFPMIASMAGIYGFGGEAVYCASKVAQVGFAQALDQELRPQGIKVGVICPGGVKTGFALGKGRTAESVAQSVMLEPEDVAAAVVLACTQAPGSRIIEIQPVEDGYRFITLRGTARLVEDGATAQQDIRHRAARYHGEETADRQMREQFSTQERVSIDLAADRVPMYGT